MRIGLGVPAGIPGTPAPATGAWAESAVAHGFSSVGVNDRLAYDNIDPLIALAAAAARTRHVELRSTVLNVPSRRTALPLAKQFASLDPLSGGRPTEGLALGGWPEDHAAVGPSAAHAAWQEAGRRDRPRVVVERCFALGPGAADTARHHLAHHHTDTHRDAVMADALPDVEHLGGGIGRLRATGCDDLLLLPCDPDLGQVDRLADASAVIGAPLRAERAPA